MAAGDGPWHYLLANLGSFLHRKRLDPLAQSLDVMLEVRVYDFDITASPPTGSWTGQLQDGVADAPQAAPGDGAERQAFSCIPTPTIRRFNGAAFLMNAAGRCGTRSMTA